MLRAASIILSLLLLSSCTAGVSYQAAVDSFLDAAPCCTTMSEFKYDPLSSEGAVTFLLDENSESFVFPSGKSYFKAFRLPNRGIPYRIHVKSFALGETINKAHIFYPQIALLDDRFTVCKLSDPGDFVLKKVGLLETSPLSWGMAVNLKLEGSMKVDIPDARYLVIYTTRELMGSMTSEHMALDFLTAPVNISGGLVLVPIPFGKHPVDIPSSPFGGISIKCEF